MARSNGEGTSNFGFWWTRDHISQRQDRRIARPFVRIRARNAGYFYLCLHTKREDA